MLHQIDLSLKPQRPQLSLAKPDKTIIAKLPEAMNITLKQMLIGVDELNFQIVTQIDKNHILIDNPHVTQCKNRYLIQLTISNLTKWFIIDKVTQNSDTSADTIQIQAFSLEYELANRFIRNYKTDSILFNDVVNVALTDTLWTLGSIPSSILNTYRSFNVSSSSLLAFINDIATKFNMVALFDTINRQVNFYNINDIGLNKGLTITDRKYLISLNSVNDNVNFCTRLKPYGNNNLTINRVNTTGQSYIENFSYFLNPFTRDINKVVLTHSDYMSDSLCNAQLDYQALVASKVGSFQTLLNQLTGISQVETTTVIGTITTAGNATIIVTAVEMTNSPKTINVAVALNDTSSGVASKIRTALISDTNVSSFFIIGGSGSTITLTVKTIAANDTTMNISINNGTCAGLTPVLTSTNTTLGQSGYQPTLLKQQSDLSDLNATMATINTNIQNAIASFQDPSIYYTQKTNQQVLITSKQTDINNTNASITSVNSQITTLQNSLSLSTNFTSAQLTERNQFIIEKEWVDSSFIIDTDLYNTALDKLNEYNTPPVVMKLNIVNFLEMLSESNNWTKLVLGDTIIIKHPKLNLNITARIMEVDFTFESSDINLTISNISKLETYEQKINKLLYKANYAGNIIDVNQSSWTSAQTNAQNYSTTQIQSLNQSLMGLATTTNIISSDGYITLAESQTLNTAMNQLNSESTDIINKALLLGNITERTNYQTALTNLQTELNNWIDQNNYPIYITATQRTNINTLFQNVQNTKSLLINAQSEMRNTNVAGWGIESGGTINYSNLRITIPAKTLFVSYTETDTVNHIGTVTVSSTSGFPSNGYIYYEWQGIALMINRSSYTSIDATHFYGVSNVNQFASIISNTDVYIYPDYNTGVLIDVTVDAMTVVNKTNKRFNISTTTFSNQPVNVIWNDVDGWEFRYIYLDGNGNLQLKGGGTWGGINQFPPLVNVSNPSPYIWLGSFASYADLIASVPNPQDKWAGLCLDTMNRYVYLSANSTWNDYGIYDANAVLIGYFIVGHGVQNPDGTFTINNLSHSFNSDGTPNYQIIKKQDFRYRNDKMIQYNSANVGVNITTYDSQIITQSISAGSYFTTYIPLGVGKRQCDVSITSSTSITAADTLRQGAKFTVGRKPGAGSSAGIKLVSGVYVDVNGYATHVDQKRNSTSPAYGDYIIPPSSLNVNYVTIYDMDLMPYPSDPTQICLKVVFYNYYTASETVNLRFTWQAT